MDSILDSLYPGSWNGVSFLIEDSSVTGGRKTVSHELVNSDVRIVEDLGLNNETINIGACVPTADYFSNRDAIKSALESKGYGTLIHPFYGIRNAACTNYTINESTQELGYVKISMTLVVGQELSFSTSGIDSFGSVFGLNDLFSSSLATMLISLFVFDSRYGRYSDEISNVLSTIGTQFSVASGLYITRSEFLSGNTADYLSAFTLYKQNSRLFLRDAELFNDSTQDLAVKLDLITPDGRSGYDAARLLSKYELPATLKVPVTPAQNYRNKMALVVKVYIKSLAFGLCCQNAAIFDFATIDEYNQIRKDLDDQYMALINLFNELAKYIKEGTGGDALTDAREKLVDLCSLTVNYIGQASTTLPNIIEVPGQELSLTVLTYSYYGALDKVPFLQELNFPQASDPSFLSDNVKILSGES